MNTSKKNINLMQRDFEKDARIVHLVKVDLPYTLN